MAKAKNSQASGNSRQIRPALTPEARQNQLIALAADLVEKKIDRGNCLFSRILIRLLYMALLNNSK